MAEESLNRFKVAFGDKNNINEALGTNKIDNYDLMFLNTKEIGWIDENGNVVMATPKTQTDIVLNGLSVTGIDDGSILRSGKSLDDIAILLLQSIIPQVVQYVNTCIGNINPDVDAQYEAFLLQSKSYTDNQIKDSLRINEVY